MIRTMFFLLLTVVVPTPFIGCKKNGSGAPANIEADMKAFHQLINRMAKHFEQTQPAHPDDIDGHTAEMTQWIATQPGVATVDSKDAYVFDITHDNGLSGNLIFHPQQTEPKLMTRGGVGAKAAMRIFNGLTADEKLIDNKNVLVVVAYAEDFYAPYSLARDVKHLADVIDLFDNAAIDFTVTTKVNEGIEAFTQLDNYGLIIFNTHGSPTGLCTGQRYLQNNLVAFDDNVAVDAPSEEIASKLRDGEIKLTSIWEYSPGAPLKLKDASYELTFSFFQSLPVTFDNTVLVGNYCYSGIENGIMADVLAPKGLKTFYGYGYHNGFSTTVTNELAWRAEDTIITNLIGQYDTTGIAHLADNTIPLQDDLAWSTTVFAARKQKLAERFITGPVPLRQFLDKGYRYPKCGDSITDKRDGKQYATACIGEQVWMAENLNWAGAGVCYNSSTASCRTYGRLYGIDELLKGEHSNANPSGVRGICPEGWHVPSQAEWVELIDFVGGEARAGVVLRSKSRWPAPNGNTDNYGFAMLPGGLMVNGQNGWVSQYQGEGGYYWTSSVTSGYNVAVNTWGSQVSPQTYDDTFRFSCRCVKDK